MTFLGARDDARALLARADLLLVSSDSEGQSIAVLEALAAGMPVVSTPVSGMRELEGVVIAGFDPGSLAAAVRELLQDPLRRTGLGAAGAALMLERFSVETMVEAYERSYLSLVPTIRNWKCSSTELLAILSKRRYGVIAIVMLTVAFSAALALVTPPRYAATATLALTPKIDLSKGFISATDLSALLSTYAETAKSSVNRARAEQILGRKLPGEIDTSTVGGTGILRITGSAAVPKEASDTASAAASAFQQSVKSNPLITVSVIDPATPPLTPVQPRPPLIVAIGILLGLLAGISYALVMERVRRRIETPSDLDPITDKPVVGRLPRQRALQRVPASLVWNQERMTGLQESYRALRTNVQFLAETRRVIEITSPDPAQGKSTVTANLGAALAQIGIDCVIVDADLRRPTQHKIFGVDNSTGLSTLLSVRDPQIDLKPSASPICGLSRAARYRRIRRRCCTCASSRW